MPQQLALIADFLGSQPPYDALTADELLALVSRAEVEYVPAGKTLIVAGAAPLDQLWVVRTGALEVIDRGRVQIRQPGEV